jgi:hypothetical protein
MFVFAIDLVYIWSYNNICVLFLFFKKLNVILKLFVCYDLVFVILIFSFTISTASSVNYEANKIYKTLNQIMVYNSLRRINDNK